jgi:hypothetical protein
LFWHGGEKEQRSSCSRLFKEMKFLVSNFQGFSFSFVKREANKATHLCARDALSLDSLVVAYDCNPLFSSCGCSARIYVAD